MPPAIAIGNTRKVGSVATIPRIVAAGLVQIVKKGFSLERSMPLVGLLVSNANVILYRGGSYRFARPIRSRGLRHRNTPFMFDLAGELERQPPDENGKRTRS